MMNIMDTVNKLTSADLFERNKDGVIASGVYVGRPFQINFDRMMVLMADAWKQQARGIPQGSLLLAYYENEQSVSEALLLRVIADAKLPTDDDMIKSMVEYYKDGLRTSGEKTQLDSFTRYEFSFSGCECRILGAFYKDRSGSLQFGADVENYYAANNYSVFKPSPKFLEMIVNIRDGSVIGKPTDIKIGTVRFSSTRRFQEIEPNVPVYVTPSDFLGKRTALFGMTRTGKSNTVKKIIEATVAMSEKAKGDLTKILPRDFSKYLDPLTSNAVPVFPVGQIIFDVNGEYANSNMQDAGTAIYEIYKSKTVRYSVLEKPDFKVMKVNFYQDVAGGFGLVQSHLREVSGDYVQSFVAVDLTEPDKSDKSATTRHQRKIAAYLCCLHRAGFAPPAKFKIKFEGHAEINKLVRQENPIDPSKGITLEEAVIWWTRVWDNYDTAPFFANYKTKRGREWADEDLKAILTVLSRKKKSADTPTLSGYTKLRELNKLHTSTLDKPFSIEILERLRAGEIVIVDLSQGDPEIQRLYSERICRQIFSDCMERFISQKPNNFLQFYFEEAHNLFPKREDKDLSQIYNRIAKEGAKLNIGMIYATQEVSSISANILKNTQNWFIAHLNNEDETREIKKYYDYADFAGALARFSAAIDKGFVRMKSYSNPFVVPVQIDRFAAKADV
jgi:DNA helicase HerA-like ATPase